MEEKNGEQCQQCSIEQEKKASQCNFEKGYYIQVSTSKEHRKSHAREKKWFSNIQHRRERDGCWFRYGRKGEVWKSGF